LKQERESNEQLKNDLASSTEEIGTLKESVETMTAEAKDMR